MRVRFWGVRGSIPTPLSSVQIQNRIAAVVQRITARDVVSADSREKFLASLPEWLFGTVGGNTACVEVENANGDCIILDAGSGLRELGADIDRREGFENGKTYHIIFSHFHWDHIQGLPFFNQAYKTNNRIIFYSTNPDFENILSAQMTHPYFPIPMLGPGGFGAAMKFIYLDPDTTKFRIGTSVVGWYRVNHPGGCTAYSIQEKGKKIIYCTDTEISRDNFEQNEENRSFFGNADILIIDAQYTVSEASRKKGWGHSAFSLAVDFALFWQIKKLVFFHHEPRYSDKKLYTLKQSAEWHRGASGNNLEIEIAQEGLDLIV
ncbi:MBL fold metallo-hydrolase [Brucepastera parasyntrophica]|uniref:MBL fold metallo-hydrolase n=1 Tax=Brucepastera parasyntrophica TaxID=2880008 RepID=UPI00210B6BC8|nr:MBL fold metallo-hydrolase [Brucepastera parasyntrophica]ULQ59984.1 MBL fold metallo-hydrolase [Brucepastera parasyntrophica]